MASDLLPQLLVVEQVRPQAQARDRRLQIVGDGGQHPRPVLHETADAPLHRVERACRLGDLHRPGLGQRRAVDVLAERVGGAAQIGQRLDDPTHRDDRDRGHADEQYPEGEQHLDRPIEKPLGQPSLEPDPGTVGKPYLDEEVAGHRMHPVHHRRCPVAHPHHRVPGHGPGHDESAEADPELGVRSQTLPELSMHQLGSGRVAVVGWHLQRAGGETNAALGGAQDG